MALTTKQSEDLKNLLGRVELGEGIGTEDSPCSIAAVNLALSGELTDTPPDCMSLVIGKWIIDVQDKMPHATRNCRQWKELLTLAAGTGRDREKEEKRFHLLIDWMWERVLPLISTEGWPAEVVGAWEKTLSERSLECAWEISWKKGFRGVNLHAVRDALRLQSRLTSGSCPTGDELALAITNTTRNANRHWGEGVWDDADGLDVIGTLERLIEV